MIDYNFQIGRHFSMMRSREENDNTGPIDRVEKKLCSTFEASKHGVNHASNPSPPLQLTIYPHSLPNGPLHIRISRLETRYSCFPLRPSQE